MRRHDMHRCGKGDRLADAALGPNPGVADGRWFVAGRKRSGGTEGEIEEASVDAQDGARTRGLTSGDLSAAERLARLESFSAA